MGEDDNGKWRMVGGEATSSSPSMLRSKSGKEKDPEETLIALPVGWGDRIDTGAGPTLSASRRRRTERGVGRRVINSKTKIISIK